MKYDIIRTDTADAGIRRIILYIAHNFENDVALEKLSEMEDWIRAKSVAFASLRIRKSKSNRDLERETVKCTYKDIV